MATTNYGWTTPALGSANNVPADLASLAAQIDTTVADLHEDTGWTAATLASGFTGTARVRRVGAVVEVSVEASGTIPTGTTTVATIPLEFCPSSSGLTLPRLAARLSGGYAGVAAIGSTGSVAVENQTGSSRTQALVRGTWMLG